MLSRRTSAILSVVPIVAVVALVLTQHGAPAAKPLPPLPSREEIARAQAFFHGAEAVCYRSWSAMRNLPRVERPRGVRTTGPRMVRVHERTVARLERLGAPPPKAARRFRRALALLRLRNEERRRAIAFFRSGAQAHASRAEVDHEVHLLVSGSQRLNAKIDAVADPVGLWKCRK